jgi:hypothetical protein
VDAPVVVKSFMTRDLAALSKHIGSELQERMAGMFKHFEALVSHGRSCVASSSHPMELHTLHGV